MEFNLVGEVMIFFPLPKGWCMNNIEMSEGWGAGAQNDSSYLQPRRNPRTTALFFTEKYVRIEIMEFASPNSMVEVSYRCIWA